MTTNENNTYMDWGDTFDYTTYNNPVTGDTTSIDGLNTSNIMNKSLGNNTGQSYTGMYFNNTPSIQASTGVDVKTTDGFDFSNMFSNKNIGSTLQGIGSIGGALASIYGVSQQQKFNEDMLDMEKKRVNREYAKADAQQAEYDAVWKS